MHHTQLIIMCEEHDDRRTAHIVFDKRQEFQTREGCRRVLGAIDRRHAGSQLPEVSDQTQRTGNVM